MNGAEREREGKEESRSLGPSLEHAVEYARQVVKEADDALAIMKEQDAKGEKIAAIARARLARMDAEHKARMAGLCADPSAFSCSICLELLYKPAVNTCGHVFCYWCMHRAMDLLNETHHCPLCREEFTHFPAVCWPLQKYLTDTFWEMKQREEEVAKLEKEEYNAESPRAPAALKSKDQNRLEALLEIFQCVECKKTPAPPTVLTCGHIVCCGTAETALRKKKTCPVKGCIGKMAAAGQPKVCSVIDTILREYMTEESYAEAASTSSCCGGILLDSASSAANVDDMKDESISFAPGDRVVIEGLQSETGSKFNGKNAKIESHDISTSRYTCTILDVSPTVTISVKPENLRKPKEDRYVHYGVGCDGCGVFPIIGKRWKCDDCSEEIGFDLCGDCYDAGVHKREGNQVGRFNQQHRPDHNMVLMEQDDTFFHQLQRAHPNVPLSQLLSMVEMSQSGAEDSGDEDGDDEEE